MNPSDFIAFGLVILIVLLISRCAIPQLRALVKSWREMRKHSQHEEFRRRKEREDEGRRY